LAARHLRERQLLAILGTLDDGGTLARSFASVNRSSNSRSTSWPTKPPLADVVNDHNWLAPRRRTRRLPSQTAENIQNLNFVEDFS
jgi:hypothetical protein